MDGNSEDGDRGRPRQPLGTPGPQDLHGPPRPASYYSTIGGESLSVFIPEDPAIPRRASHHMLRNASNPRHVRSLVQRVTARGGYHLVLLLAPWALIIIGVPFYQYTPPGMTASPFFVSAALIAAPFQSLRATVAVALAAVSADVLLEVFNGTAEQPEAIIEMVAVVCVGVIAVVVNLSIARHARRLRDVTTVAEVAQRALLPTPADDLTGLRVATHYQAADTEARIGGDLYALQDSRTGVRLMVGDIKGKGLEAVAVVATIIGAFSEAAHDAPDLQTIAARIERALNHDGLHRSPDRSEAFTTAVLAEITPDRRRIHLLNRGHPAPLLLLSNGIVRVCEPANPALPLGLNHLGTWSDETLEVDFPPGATFVLFTDGLTEARNARGDFYDPAERLSGRAFDSPRTLLTALTEDVARHTGGHNDDDMALMAITREPHDSGLGTDKNDEKAFDRGEQPRSTQHR
ncbi:PP2C family protein-serine/threonine phosphatase [Streptomyces polyrhachis]|uniref:PP2C family protein-serine/threonine phosphatase n=1 Tax=Streptomyces polyrhachis TaxID=1282885 RepID=A0ABW2GJP6_9ACTN